MPLEQYQLGYIAGIFDGEGCICLNHQYPSVSCKPSAKISNTNLEALQVIQGWVGGRIYKLTNGEKHPTWNMVYGLSWSSQRDILELLRVIEPYLIIKKAQAQLMIAWCVTHLAGEGTKFTNGWDGAKEDEFKDLMGILNKRGV